HRPQADGRPPRLRGRPPAVEPVGPRRGRGRHPPAPAPPPRDRVRGRWAGRGPGHRLQPVADGPQRPVGAGGRWTGHRRRGDHRPHRAPRPRAGLTAYGEVVANRLAHSTSPYLRQHADNPVDWWEWGEEAFAEARRRDVPVLLSVGYAACHWC